MGITDFGYRKIARPVLFRWGHGDAEAAHRSTLQALARIQRHPVLLRGLARVFASATAPRHVFGLAFANPVGLAAGADKDGLALKAWPALGFGFVEAGTVTALAQPGNSAPRVFRLRESQGVINRMGFPNGGAAALAAACARTGSIGVPLGISLGKSKIVPVDRSEAMIDDYLTSLRAVQAHADYIAVNVSSPNTPGLRGLQDRAALDDLIGALTREAVAQGLANPVRRGGAPVPILVKISPDLGDDALADVLQVCHDRGIAGVIATNTTVGRPNISPADRGVALEAGGLSGTPLAARALEVVRFVCRHTQLPVIGVGGISTPDHALAMLDTGASLVQLYTGTLYQGPGLNRAITKAVAAAAKHPGR